MPKRQGNSYPSRKRQRHGKTSLHNQIATLQATLLTTTRTLAGCLKKTGKQETKESSDSSSESSQGDSTETQEITDDLPKVYFNKRFNNNNRKPNSAQALAYIQNKPLRKILRENRIYDKIVFHRASFLNWANGDPDLVSIQVDIPFPTPEKPTPEEKFLQETEHQETGTTLPPEKETNNDEKSTSFKKEYVHFFRLPFRQSVKLPTNTDYGKHLRYFIKIHSKHQIIWCPPTPQ